MLAYNISITRNTAGPALRRLALGLAPERLNGVVGPAARDATKAHFEQLNRERPNALGGKRTNYYFQIADNTSFAVVPGGVVISMPGVGLSLHFYGGVVKAGKSINPKTGRPTVYLTEPARAEAHGRTAADFPDLEVLWGRHGPYALARIQRTNVGFGKARADGHRRVLNRGTVGGEILFWLKKEVTLRPDPSVLPAPDRIYGAVLSNLNSYTDRLLARQGGTAT